MKRIGNLWPGIIEFESLTAHESDILEFRLAILQQIVPERRETDAGHRGDAEHRKTHYHQELGGNSQIAKHCAPITGITVAGVAPDLW